MSAHPLVRARLLAPAFAFCATLLSLPSAAVSIPDTPLQTGTAYPPPNIMFIIDDSGSMQWDFMPGANSSSELPAVSPSNIAINAYNRNTLYYNPNISYLPWVKSDLTRYTGGRSYTTLSAYSDDSLLTGATNLSSSNRTFYVPRDQPALPATQFDYSKTASYYRYYIPAGGNDMTRSTYGTVVGTSGNNYSGFPKTSGSAIAATTGNGNSFTFTVAANTSKITFTTSGGSHGTNGNRDNNNGSGADVYLADPTGATVCSSTGGGNDDSCSIDYPVTGTWTVTVSAASGYKNVTLDGKYDTSNRCPGTGSSGSTDWIDCVSATPDVHNDNGTITQRSLVDELVNYATWYSYHRTRIKVAKAGASEAFSRLNSNLRVGYDSIWNRNPYLIPVGISNGVFQGANRDNWYAHLVAADANNGTPLKGALQRTGEYFSDSTSTGPWGPESGSNQISCRQNFAILTTDGYWNDNSGYNNPVGDTDKTAGPTITDGADLSYTYNPVKPFIDNFSGSTNSRGDTLADVAMYYWKRDLVTTLTNNVPYSNADPAFWQHMVTFGVSIGLQGRLDPKSDLGAITLGTKRWGDPTDAEDADRIDDLWHASINGHGNFVTARDPQEFAQALADALATVQARNGSASNVTANTTSFISGSRVYQARYVSGKWIGELAAYDATASGAANTPAWVGSAGITYTGRKVFTWNGTAGTTFPTTAQTTSLVRTTGIAPVNGTDNVNYIKGETINERRMGGDLRSRDVLLGDIVNSSPMYVADTNTLYVGANDGMLHAFDAGDTSAATTTDGKELFAYVPSGIDFTALSTYSDPQYVHHYFVDGPVVVSSRKQTPGKNILVGALGRGGKGLYALDVSDPTNFGATNAMWELRDNGGDMGMVTGDPLIVTLNDAAKTKAVIVSNGFNSTNQHSVLFIIDLMTGAVLKKLDTGVGGDNGMSEPRGRDVDGNGTVDVVYAGDLKGNLWKFDLSGTTAATWTIALGGSPMYTTRSNQPITTGLAIARNALDGRSWVFFGTGRYLSVSDISDNTVQSLYGIIDSNTTVTESNLQARDIPLAGVIGGRKVRSFEQNTPLPVGKKGWVLDLDNPTAGERVVVRPQMRGAALVASSMTPPTASTCDAGGSGYINALDAFTGTALVEPFFDADANGTFDNGDKLGSGSGATGVGSVGTGSGSPTKGVFIGNTIFYSKTDGGDGDEQTNNSGGLPRRVQWREILQD